MRSGSYICSTAPYGERAASDDPAQQSLCLLRARRVQDGAVEAISARTDVLSSTHRRITATAMCRARPRASPYASQQREAFFARVARCNNPVTALLSVKQFTHLRRFGPDNPP